MAMAEYQISALLYLLYYTVITWQRGITLKVFPIGTVL